MRRFQRTSFRSTQECQSPAETSDTELVAEARCNPQAFGHLFDRYCDDFFRFCYYRIGDWHQAEDATSQVFLNAFSSLDRFDPLTREDSFRSWLFGIARHVVGKSWRYSNRHPSEPVESASDLPDTAESVETAVLIAERRRELAAVFSHLTPDQQELLELRLSGLSSVEIASVLGRSQESVRKAQSRAVMTLRSLLTDESALKSEKRYG